jgi:uncharacterized membrane protein YczE
VFIGFGIYFLNLLPKNINFYSKWSIIFMSIGLLLRVLLFIADLSVRLIDNPEGLLIMIINHDAKWDSVIRNVFVYEANCLFYFSYFSVGCDWTELFLAFRLVVLKNKPVAEVENL